MENSDKLRAISEFDGFVYINDDPIAYPNGYMYHKGDGAIQIKDLRYNESWDWIMPIFAKIVDWYNDNEIDFTTNSNIMEGIYHVDLDIFFNDIYETIEWIKLKENGK